MCCSYVLSWGLVRKLSPEYDKTYESCFITSRSALKLIKTEQYVCVYMGLWDLHCAPPCGFRTTLCTIDLPCAPLGYVVHHVAQGGLMCVRSGGHPRHTTDTFVVDNEHANQGSQCSSVPTYTILHVRYQFLLWWCTIHCCWSQCVCELHCAPTQWHRAMLCTTELCCVPPTWSAQVVHKGTDTEYCPGSYINYSHSVVHNVHTNQGSQFLLTYTLVVYNVALTNPHTHQQQCIVHHHGQSW